MGHAAWGAAEAAARDSYGRLVAWLAWRWRDLAAAEDALGQALLAALEHWPRTGIPDKPDAWLLATARRELLQVARHHRLEQSPEVQALLEDEAAAPAPPDVPDNRLALMFVCAHPQLPANIHAPLMLQTVLGLQAQQIAQAFLVSPAAMAQRLVRAKARIREAGLRFAQPEARELPPRTAAVLEGIYGCYTIATSPAGGAPDGPAAEPPGGLGEEALFLARLMVRLAPASAEAWGLVALLSYCECRAPAQWGPGGEFVPLARQDTARWRRDLLQSAEESLRHAASLRQPGPLQLEAAIQSAHCQRASTGSTPWRAIVQLYDTLLRVAPTTGARIGHAVAVAEAGDAAGGLALLHALDPQAVATHQGYWVAAAHLAHLSGDAGGARSARSRAIGLTADPRIRDFLLAQQVGPAG